MQVFMNIQFSASRRSHLQREQIVQEKIPTHIHTQAQMLYL